MKSYLKMAVEGLGYLLCKLLTLLKSVSIKIAKNPILCQIILVVILICSAWGFGNHYGTTHTEPTVKTVYVQVTPDPELIRSLEAEKTQRDQNIDSIAKVLYGYRYNSERDLEGIVWIILNRMDNQSEFRSFETVQAVVNQPSQWMGYSSENPILEDLWNIADNTLYKYETDGKRLFGQEYLYFEWRSDYITFKTELYDSKTCQKWRAY